MAGALAFATAAGRRDQTKVPANSPPNFLLRRPIEPTQNDVSPLLPVEIILIGWIR
jgi:hypothetical protein